MKPYTIPDPSGEKQASTPAADGEQTGQARPHTQGSGDAKQSAANALDTAESISDKQENRDYADAQQHQGRSIATHPSEQEKHNTIGETAAHSGNLDRLTFDSNNQGISNHAASVEAEGQKKVTDDRAIAQQSVNQNLKK